MSDQEKMLCAVVQTGQGAGDGVHMLHVESILRVLGGRTTYPVPAKADIPQTLASLVENGLVTVSGPSVSLTNKGRAVARKTDTMVVRDIQAAHICAIFDIAP